MNRFVYFLSLCLVNNATQAIKIEENLFIPPNIYRHQEEPLENSRRFNSLPYMSGDTFRQVATFFVDELRLPINPNDIKDGDIIFLKPILKEYFFTELHPRINARYILISHNCDLPSPGKFAYILDDPKLIAWFTVNPDIANHPKLFPIPIGLANRYWPYGNVETFDTVAKNALRIKKDILLYFNMNTRNNELERKEAENAFTDKNFCYKPTRKSYHEYLIDLARSQFVVSPHGAGLDCYRTWEALLMGCIPIVKKSTLDPLYEDLPVIIVENWHEVTEEFLYNKLLSMQKKSYNHEKLFAKWWIDKIRQCQKEFLKTLN